MKLAAVLLFAVSLQAHEGWGVIVDPRFGVVVSDVPGNTIWRIRDGRLEALVRGVHSHDVVLGKDGALYGTDPKTSGGTFSVWRLDAAGKFSYVIPPAADSVLGLQSFLITDDGAIYSGGRYDPQKPAIALLRRERTGEISRVADGFRGIDDISVMPDGNVLLVDGAYLRTVTPDGRIATVAGPLTQRRWDEDLLGISSIRDSAVHVADHAGRRILRVDLRTGQATEVYRSDFFWAPAGVEVVDGTLYVLEHLRPPLALLGDLKIGPYLRVRRIGSGKSETLAVVWGRMTWIVVVAAAAVSTTVALWRRTKRR